MKNIGEILRDKRIPTLATVLSIGTLAACGGTKATSGSASNKNSVSDTASVSDLSVPLFRAVLLKGSRHVEIEKFGATTYTDYETVNQIHGPRLAKGTRVTVDCLATGPVDVAPSADGEWYHISSPVEYAGFFVAANTFKNGDDRGSLRSQPAVDPTVPSCPAP